jgi:hypothetical protein
LFVDTETSRSLDEERLNMKENLVVPIVPVNSAADIACKDLSAVFEHWQQLGGGEALPHPDQLDLLKLQDFLNQLYLFDTIDNGSDYLCVYNGNFHQLQQPALKSGQTIGNTEPSRTRNRIRALFDKVIEEKRPILYGPAQSAESGRGYKWLGCEPSLVD